MTDSIASQSHPIIEAVSDLLDYTPVQCRACEGWVRPEGDTRVCRHCDELKAVRTAAQTELNEVPVLKWEKGDSINPNGETARLGPWTCIAHDTGVWTIYLNTVVAGRSSTPDSLEGVKIMVENVMRSFKVLFRTVKK